MTKSEAYITIESFGSILPETWEEDIISLNAQIDALEQDEFGEIDRDAVDEIWNRYCALSR